jgi:hypothetical protein
MVAAPAHVEENVVRWLNEQSLDGEQLNLKSYGDVLKV